MSLGVYITLLDDEKLIAECWRRAARVFPDVVVCDLGSRDGGAKLAAAAGARVHHVGRVLPEEYAAWKNDTARPHQIILWIDADEWWPESALRRVQAELAIGVDWVVGNWRNLRQDGAQLFASELMPRGRVAWNAQRFQVGRAWPRECLFGMNREVLPLTPPDPEVWCWHGVLLERSSVPEDPARAAKRKKREEQFADLVWTPTCFEALI